MFSFFHVFIFTLKIIQCFHLYSKLPLFHTKLKKIQGNVHLASQHRHGVKVGPGPRDPGPGTQDPTQWLKMGHGTPLKFKSGTPGPLSKFKSGTPGHPTEFKSGIPSPFFNEIFQNISLLFLLIYLYVFLK